MTPYYSDDWLTVYQGDCREVMASMEPESVQCVVTSPPYWGLRDYGETGQLGLEPTPEAYVASMVEVFREVRRVLRDDGTLWLNLGDSYGPGTRASIGLASKQLVGIPWRVAFALQADGWYLRSDIIWSKPNPMPESVTDRPTKSHEYLFLLSKSARYRFDADAVREDATASARPESSRQPTGTLTQHAALLARGDDPLRNGEASTLGWNRPKLGRNIRSVWTIATQPYPGAHFATFPPKLVEPCVKAGCPSKVCSECGAGWERVVDRSTTGIDERRVSRAEPHGIMPNKMRAGDSATVTRGWRPTCAHDVTTEAGVVLDPFAGSGTTGMVAQALGRRAVLIDLNGDYLVQAMRRNQQSPLGLDGAA